MNTILKYAFPILLLVPSLGALYFSFSGLIGLEQLEKSAQWATLAQSLQLSLLNLSVSWVVLLFAGWIGTITGLYVILKEFIEVKTWEEKRR